MATELQKRGYTIGPGGRKLQIGHAVADSGDTLTRGMSTTPIPKVVFTWQLLDPKGRLAWTTTTEAAFGPTLLDTVPRLLFRSGEGYPKIATLAEPPIPEGP